MKFLLTVALLLSFWSFSTPAANAGYCSTSPPPCCLCGYNPPHGHNGHHKHE